MDRYQMSSHLFLVNHCDHPEQIRVQRQLLCGPRPLSEVQHLTQQVLRQQRLRDRLVPLPLPAFNGSYELR